MVIYCRVILIALCILAQTSFGQEAGSIEGHVYGADTNAPIRMATILLKVGRDGNPPVASRRGDTSETVAVGASHLDGSFSFDHLRPGRYYVYASAPGYLDPVDPSADDVLPSFGGRNDRKRGNVALAGTDPAISNPIIVNLGSGQASARVNFQLERGASVEGRILYDDGSPMTGAWVTALKRDPHGNWKPLPRWEVHAPPDQTDDLGRYRISGLPPGEYMIEADLTVRGNHVVSPNLMGASRDSIASFSVYSGSVFYERNAASFKLTRGEDRAGEDLTFRASALHRVSGVVVAQQDGHPIPDAKIEIDAADGQAVDSVEVLDSSGAFQFEFVPEGQYVIKVTGARDLSHGQTGRQYESAQQQLILENDTTGLVIAVLPLK